MHIQKHIATKACAFACALVIIISGIGNTTLTAHASSSTTEVELERLIDISLTDVGIIADQGTLAYVKECIMGYMVAWGDSYFEYLASNLLEINESSIRSWLDTIAFDNSFAETFCKSDFGVSVLLAVYEPYADNWDSHVITDEELTTAMKLNEAKSGQTYSIPRAFINWIRGIFEDNKEDIAGYVMIPTYGPDTIPAYAFTSATYYKNFVEVLKTAGDNMLLFYNIYTTDRGSFESYGQNSLTRFTDTTISLVGELSTKASLYDNVTLYNSNWKASVWYSDPKCTYADYASFYSSGKNGNFGTVSIYPCNYSSGSGLECRFICTSDGRNVPLFKDLSSLKSYSANQAPYYTTKTYNTYDSSTNNSVTYSGDYMIDYGGSYSYETINNSNDYSQTNIDNSVTNITNNYTYINPDYEDKEDSEGGETDDSDSDSGLTLGDALNTWVNAIKEFITFAITLLGEAVALISGFLTNALNILTGLAESFTGFTDLLGAMFGFLPKELLDAMSAGIIMIVTLGVIRSFKGG